MVQSIPFNYVKKNWLLLIAHIASLLPLILLIWDYATGGLGFNPIQEATFRSGKYALVLLVLSLAVTPLNMATGWREVVPLRKWFGLYAFMYVCVHFLIFVALDYVLDPQLIYQAIFEKPYALVGFAAFLLLVPLAITSTKGWMKRLGKNWKRLHRLVYAAMVLGLLHYIWVQKSDIREPLIWTALVVGLYVLRIPAVRQPIIRWRQKLTQQRRQRQLEQARATTNKM
ncbi:MAG: sulfoxide reductase heme-binding subunit YedZ [Chloroflexaceae bacterium]|nr:sulfoxide reductase heme-binding subunit YedZ [Chloroflexaceae bacterium]